MAVGHASDDFGRRAGTPHHHLLVGIAQAMGLDVDHVGLGEIINRDGERVPLTGSLPNLS
jgi:hypothetical protein